MQRLKSIRAFELHRAPPKGFLGQLDVRWINNF